MTPQEATFRLREWYEAFKNFGKGNERTVKELLEAADLIESLAAELEDMTTRYKIADGCAKKKGEMNEKLYAELSAVKAERDAAVADILYAASVYLGECNTCKNGEVCAACKRQDACDECPNSKCMCSGCGAGRSNWQWRGVQKEE